jgi:hypothetical protein
VSKTTNICASQGGVSFEGSWPCGQNASLGREAYLSTGAGTRCGASSAHSVHLRGQR